MRAAEAMKSLGVQGSIVALSQSARTAQEAADALGVEVGQIASSLIFTLPTGGALLIITSGRHRVDTNLVSQNLKIDSLGRVNADFVKDMRNAYGVQVDDVDESVASLPDNTVTQAVPENNKF